MEADTTRTYRKYIHARGNGGRFTELATDYVDWLTSNNALMPELADSGANRILIFGSYFLI